MNNDRTDEILGKIADLKTVVETHVALSKQEFKRSEERTGKLELEWWGRAGLTEGGKADVDRLKTSEDQRKWIVRGLAGSTFGLIVHAVWKILK